MFNPEMKVYHQYYTTRKENPLKKLQSLVAISARIARIFYGILKNGTDYDPTMVMKDFNKAVAALNRRAAPLGGRLERSVLFPYRIEPYK